jgi:hypothetical protein
MPEWVQWILLVFGWLIGWSLLDSWWRRYVGRR